MFFYHCGFSNCRNLFLHRITRMLNWNYYTIKRLNGETQNYWGKIVILPVFWPWLLKLHKLISGYKRSYTISCIPLAFGTRSIHHRSGSTWKLKMASKMRTWDWDIVVWEFAWDEFGTRSNILAKANTMMAIEALTRNSSCVLACRD